jgi:hypothetical protein
MIGFNLLSLQLKSQKIILGHPLKVILLWLQLKVPAICCAIH